MQSMILTRAFWPSLRNTPRAVPSADELVVTVIPAHRVTLLAVNTTVAGVNGIRGAAYEGPVQRRAVFKRNRTRRI